MTPTIEHLLKSFEQLTEPEKHDLIVEMLRRTPAFDAPALSDEELVLAAEDLFLALDQEEIEAEERLIQ